MQGKVEGAMRIREGEGSDGGRRGEGRGGMGAGEWKE